MTQPLDPETSPDLAEEPVPAPGLVTAARSRLAARFAHGVDEVLWQGRKLPMPDREAITKVLHAAAQGADLSAEDLAAALIVSGAVRLDLDRLEADLLDAAVQYGMDWGQIASILDLSDADTARRHYHHLAVRRRQPVANVDHNPAGATSPSPNSHAPQAPTEEATDQSA